MNAVKRANGIHMLRFVKGEEFIPGIVDYCKNKEITNAKIVAIGAINGAELGYYHLESKNYSWKVFSGDYEIVAANGNITILNNEPFLHMHMVISGPDFLAYGGHLKSGKVGATCEVIIEEISGGVRVDRKNDPEIGLNLWGIEP